AVLSQFFQLKRFCGNLKDWEVGRAHKGCDADADFPCSLPCKVLLLTSPLVSCNEGSSAVMESPVCRLLLYAHYKEM
ncbi:Protein inturned, partial [Dissostichus eleginoides]